jgi:hypothetical protein
MVRQCASFQLSVRLAMSEKCANRSNHPLLPPVGSHPVGSENPKPGLQMVVECRSPGRPEQVQEGQLIRGQSSDQATPQTHQITPQPTATHTCTLQTVFIYAYSSISGALQTREFRSSAVGGQAAQHGALAAHTLKQCRLWLLSNNPGVTQATHARGQATPVSCLSFLMERSVDGRVPRAEAPLHTGSVSDDSNISSPHATPPLNAYYLDNIRKSLLAWKYCSKSSLR